MIYSKRDLTIAHVVAAAVFLAGLSFVVVGVVGVMSWL